MNQERQPEADAAHEAAHLLAASRAWLAEDPDPQTRAELAALIAGAEAGDPAAQEGIADRFGSRLAFGTAGLRGALGAGPNRMNRVLVAQAAAGFAAYLAERAAPGTTPVVVIGYDGRRNSDVFARDSAEVFAGAGLHAIVLPRMLPTPVLAFAVRHLGADAGVMVTASHNPPDDNGYKVYLGGADGGSQIVAPADGEIAAHIDRFAAGVAASRIPRSVGYATADDTVVAAYVAATAAVAPAPPGAAGLRWAYTAMHGVGAQTFAAVLDAAGYPQPASVAQQHDPDGTFPTVAFPNPEEPGAMDLVFALARETDAELVLAHDPDADRLAVGIPADVEGGWRRLTGNEIGLLLGWRAARLTRDAGTAAGTAADTAAGASLACSLVSSPGLATVAGHYGLDFYETPTGFKWISRAPGIVYGFEEALGYLVNPDTVRDKDGISAAVAVLGLAADARARGRTLSDLLAEFTEQFGHFASAQVSLRLSSTRVIGDIMTTLRDEPPTHIAGVAILRADDLLKPVDDAPAADVLRYWCEDGSRVIVRPSGTEPKLKVYLDVRGESADDAASRLTTLTSGCRELVAAVAPGSSSA